MSSKKLTNPQNAGLEKGFNFAITPKFVPKLDIINGAEAGLRKVHDEAAVQIARSKVSEFLKSAKPPQRNITHEEEEALKELQIKEITEINYRLKKLNKMGFLPEPLF